MGADRWSKLGRVVFGSLLAGMLAVGCAVATSSTDVVVEPLRDMPGCHAVCPRCPPGQICPAIACYLDCHKPADRCVSDADCTMAINTCGGGCSCEARLVGDNGPTCSEQIDNCGGSDPCAQAGYTPYCDQDHTCQLLAYAAS